MANTIAPLAPVEETTTTIIARIRQEVGCGRVPTADVLKLCERAEIYRDMALRTERALHDAIKEIEGLQEIIQKIDSGK